jgi:hypothetical protein
MNLDELLHRWREGHLNDAELAELSRYLSTPEGRKRLRQDWSFEATIPEALKSASVAKEVPASACPPNSFVLRIVAFWNELRAGYRWVLTSGVTVFCMLLTAWFLFESPAETPILTGSLAGVKVERNRNVQQPKLGMELRVNDVISTAGRNGTVIEFRTEGTRIVLGPSTVVTLRASVGAKRFALLEGRVEADVAPQLAGAMVWATDNAEARVLGTKFALSADGLLTRLDVTEGKVELLRHGATKPLLVPAGNFAVTDSEGLVGARPIAEADSPNLWNSPLRTTPGCVHTTFHSATLDVDIGVNVLLPPQYDAQPQQHFPVLYFLHGLGGDEHTEAARFARRLRLSMAKGDLPEFIAVFPNAGPGYTPRPVLAGRVFTGELPRYVDANFRTRSERDGRLVCGVGFGAKRALLYGTIDANIFGAGCAIDNTFRDGTPSFLRLIESFRRRIESNPPRLLLLQGLPHATEYADMLIGALRSKGIEIELKKLPAYPPESAAYTEAIVKELAALLARQWGDTRR